MFNSIKDTVTRPWREQMSSIDLVLYILLFLILAYGIHDMLRVLKAFMSKAVEAVE